MEGLLVLTVISYGENPGESFRVTFQPMNVATVISPEAMVQRQGMSLYKATVKLMEGGWEEVYVNGADLKVLEEAVGCYGMLGEQG